MAFVVASDRWRRSDRPKPSTVSVSSRPSRTLAAALGWSVSHRRLEWLVSLHGAPRSLRSDTGPEFIATALLRWLQTAEIDTAFIDPGKPWQNGTDESFNGTFRNECLSLEWFRNRMEAKIGIERWRRHDNEERPHMSLGALLPEHVDHPARPYAPRHIDRQTLTSELVDDGQALQRPAIHARIEDEVVGPHVIHRGRGQRSRAGREAIRRRGRRRGTCRPAWCHTREARWALIGCPRRARKTRIFRSPYRGYWPASSRMTANAGASRCRSRDTEPSVDRETDTTAHARRLDSPRRRADATCCRRTRAPTIFSCDLLEHVDLQIAITRIARRRLTALRPCLSGTPQHPG